MYQTAGGTGTAITVTIKGTLVNGYPITFIASANNSGAATTINGKKLYKPGTTTAPNLIAGKAYTVWYNQAGDCFFIKASAEGDAIAANVLAGKKFSNDNDTGLVGTMPNNGALNGSLNCSGTFNIPAGFTTGGMITANSLSSQTPANASSAQILSGFSAWVNGSLINGQATIASIGGRQFASNTAIVGSTIYKVYSPNGVTTNAKIISVSGLNFTPSVIFGYSQSKPTNRFYWHSSLPDYITLIIDYGYSQPWANVSIASTKSTVALGVNVGSFVMPLCSDGVSSGESIIWFAYS